MQNAEKPRKDESLVTDETGDLPTNSYWKPWLLWVLANTVGFGISLAVVAFLIFVMAFLSNYGVLEGSLIHGIIIVTLAGFVLGTFQWLLLRSKIQRAGLWIGATALSWGLMLPLLQFGASATILGRTYFLDELLVDVPILITIMPAFVGGIIGLFQWLVLRSQVRRACIWIITSIIGYTCAEVFMRFLLLNEGIIVFVVLASGVLLGMLTGIGFVYLFDQSSQRLKHSAILTGASILTLLVVTLPIGISNKQKLVGEIDSGYVTYLTFSPNGDVLASHRYSSGEVNIWDVDTGLEVNTLKSAHSVVDSIVFSPDGHTLAIASSQLMGGDVELWDLENKQIARSFPYELPFVNIYDSGSVAFSPDGSLATTWWSSVLVHDVDNGHILQVLDLEPTTNPNTSNSWLWTFSSDGNLFIFGTDNIVEIWSVESGQKINIIQGFDGEVLSLAISPDGKIVAIGTTSSENPVQLWDVSSGMEKQRFGGRFMVTIVAFSPDGTLLAVGNLQGNLELYDVSTGQMVKRIETPSSRVDSIAFSPDGKIIATAGGDTKIRLWDISDIP